MRLFTDIKEIQVTYNRKIGAANGRLKKQLQLFDQGINVRKKKKPVIETYSNKWYDKNCMRLAKAIVRRRDKVCQRCGGRSLLQCSHVINDGIDTRMSVDPDNMKLLCKSCHIYWWHKNPREALEWFESKRPGRRDMLKERSLSYDRGSITNEWWVETYEKLSKG